MPCDTWVREDQSKAEREREIQRTITALDRMIAAGAVSVRVGPQGALALVGWGKDARRGVTDVCAVRRLRASGSAAFRMALQRAQAAAGRAVSWQAVGAGVHSHDGGRSWGPGH